MTAGREAGTPVTDAEIAELFGPLARWPAVMLAVSGGSDSLALLHLYARWRSLGFGANPAAMVVTVDHGLRAESRAEAEFVASEARSLGLAHETLTWEGDKPTTGRQAAARDARYRLMGERLAQDAASPRALVTAHTQDDQAETVLMRLARGSGIDGLAAMAPERPLHSGSDITLVRPLLSVPGNRLKATLTALDRKWIEDPSNANPANERVRVRQVLASATERGLSSEALSLTAHRLQRARAALEVGTTALEQTAAVIRWGLSTTIARARFEAAPVELRLRLIDRALLRHGGSHPRARLIELERLCERLPGLTGATTLGGCLIIPGADGLMIVREPGRAGLPEIVVQPGETAVWDDRFEVAHAAGAPAPVTVRAMPPEVWAAIRGIVQGAEGITTAVAMGLPTIWQGETLVAVPPLAALTGPLITRHIACIAADGFEAGSIAGKRTTLLPLAAGELARRKSGEKA